MNKSLRTLILAVIPASLLYGCPPAVVPPAEIDLVTLTIVEKEGGVVTSEYNNKIMCPGRSCSATYEVSVGETVSADVLVVADQGWTFVGFEDVDNACDAFDYNVERGLCTIDMVSDRTVTPIFTKDVPDYDLWMATVHNVLYTVDVTSGETTVKYQMRGFVPPDFNLRDIAFDPKGDLYGVGFNNLYLINQYTGALTHIGALNVSPGMNALAFDSDGTLYGAHSEEGSLYTIDTTTGGATLVGSGGYTSGGDLVFHNGELLLTQVSRTSILSILIIEGLPDSICFAVSKILNALSIKNKFL